MTITLTDVAAERIKSFLADRGKGEGVRVGVKTTGCSGLAYTVEFVDQIESDDKVFEDHELKIVVDAKSLIYLDGSELDYQKEGLSEGFKFNNPNVKDMCGCGESFTV